MSTDQNLQQFERLLKNLLSDINEIRKEAETVFQQFMQQQPDGIIHALLAISRQSQDDVVSFFQFFL
jgi:flagellar hook-basal body complex protein FliE